MRIEVIGDDESSNAQVARMPSIECSRRWPEHTQRVRGVRVVLRRDDRNATTGHAAVCAVTVALEPSGSLRTRACDRQAYAAIDRAVERIGDLMRRRVAQHVST